MTFAINIWKRNREILHNLLESHDQTQLNMIPTGFNNNLIWNLGHIVAVQQILIYKASGLPTYVSAEFIQAYKMGSKPTGIVPLTGIDEVKSLLLKSMDWLKEDLENHKFSSYNSITTSTGFTMTSVEEAIQFNNYHEAMHLGNILSIRKFV